MPVELALGMPAGHWAMRTINGILAVCRRVFPTLLGYQLLYAVRLRPDGVRVTANGALANITA